MAPESPACGPYPLRLTVFVFGKPRVEKPAVSVCLMHRPESARQTFTVKENRAARRQRGRIADGPIFGSCPAAAGVTIRMACGTRATSEKPLADLREVLVL